MKRILITLCLLVLTSTSFAKEAVPMADDPALEARLMKISKELRCLVCQNETLADSHADLAKDLRREVRELINQGKTDEQIKVHLTQRYGDFVLYKPRVNAKTWLLWFGPFAMLLGITVGVGIFLKKRRNSLIETPLTPAESARIKSLLTAASSKESTSA
jgi:cytochrome c-type biogenesis protein CcmH